MPSNNPNESAQQVEVPVSDHNANVLNSLKSEYEVDPFLEAMISSSDQRAEKNDRWDKYLVKKENNQENLNTNDANDNKIDDTLLRQLIAEEISKRDSSAKAEPVNSEPEEEPIFTKSQLKDLFSTSPRSFLKMLEMDDDDNVQGIAESLVFDPMDKDTPEDVRRRLMQRNFKHENQTLISRFEERISSLQSEIENLKGTNNSNDNANIIHRYKNENIIPGINNTSNNLIKKLVSSHGIDYVTDRMMAATKVIAQRHHSEGVNHPITYSLVEQEIVKQLSDLMDFAGKISGNKTFSIDSINSTDTADVTTDKEQKIANIVNKIFEQME